MGGTAVLIWGHADVDRLSHRGFLDRLLGRGQPREVKLWDNRTLIELPSNGVQTLIPELKDYIRRRVSSPWPATTSILDYLDLATSVDVRGERADDAAPEWYVQIGFSGCAGMAEISSLVAAHWARLWYAQEQARIGSILSSAGFSPTHLTGTRDDFTYLPLGETGYGYAAFCNEGGSIETDEPPTCFEIDGAAVEDNEEHAAALLRGLEADWVDFMSTGRCHCQLCDPAFDPTRLESLQDRAS